GDRRWAGGGISADGPGRRALATCRWSSSVQTRRRRSTCDADRAGM
ncbi:MAG: hypothetical protein AVDCRST_MAG49-1442, partial [uncultured Thermomicrobiales bacterium]